MSLQIFNCYKLQKKIEILKIKKINKIFKKLWTLINNLNVRREISLKLLPIERILVFGRSGECIA